jgi:hypothetical protein
MSARLAGLSLLMAIALSPGAALAHAFLDHSVPAVGSTVSAPTELRLFFTQDLEPAFSGVAITTDDGRAVAIGAPAIAPQNRAEMVVKLPALASGHV